MGRRSSQSNGSAGPPEYGDQDLSGRMLQQNDAGCRMSAMRRWPRGGRISVGRRWRVWQGHLVGLADRAPARGCLRMIRSGPPYGSTAPLALACSSDWRPGRVSTVCVIHGR